ncbi:MAG: DUF4364 family protein [Oscillospiraceae bacterium]|jgi:hypothetical protein|nr:DUF4364 family protein [Oscillospiraceae bacterium]MBP1555960.1 DUF4364 family protein [Oscillospiraceae bacterium]MBQ5340922.1 DUF4364 family protein [Oscillospiraceae bacterium]MBQ5342338.1 DUF4364 family protein [Oscillospiraceae bacterium]MBR5064756.1 DUF4364 family protein [Oscillospiraceae bacterium]
MPNDAFTEGIVPGGLTSHSEVKILCCYLLNIQNKPVPQDVLVSAVSKDGLVNYFELVSALTELTDSGQIILEDGCYRISDSGRQIAVMLSGDLPFSVRSKAGDSLRYLAEHERKSHDNKVEIKKTDTGYEVLCSISDSSDGPLYSLSVYVPSLKAANTVRDNFIDKAEQLLRYDLSLLTGEDLTEDN